MDMDENEKKQEHEVFLRWLWAILAFIFPVTEYMFHVMWYQTHPETEKKSRIASIIGAGIQIVFVLAMLLVFLINPTFTLGTLKIRSFLFYVSLLYALECASALIFAHMYYVRFPQNTNTKFYLIGHRIAIFLTIAFSVLAVYEMDSVLKSIPKGIPFDDPVVAFYAIFILFGAVMAYLIASNKVHKLGGKRDMLEAVFYLAFPLGIVGARIWWVISEWNRELLGNHTLSAILNIRQGGLAIQGGVLLGAWVGAWFLIEKRRNIPIMKLTDAIVPGILIAQAIGRLGNFTNVEVYGQVANASDWWFLPQIIIEQYNSHLGHFVVPLFLIEALMNVLGYFVLTYIVNGCLKKWTCDGDASFGYLIWYGVVRLIMEPMRDPKYIMGTSEQMSIVFIVVGVLCVIINHVWHLVKKNKPQLKEKWIAWCHKMSEKMDNNSNAMKIIGALPIIDGFYYGFYRFVKGHYYTGISWIIVGSVFGWILDLVWILNKKNLLMSQQYV